MLGDPPDFGGLQRYWAPEELVRLGLTGPDRMPPDHAFRYSNLDYVLRGLIVERATGQRFDSAPYQEFTVLSPSEAYTSGAMVSTAGDLARFLDGLAIIRYDYGDGNVAYGFQGGVPGYTSVALRTTNGRCLVLWQNGLDLHDSLPWGAPFIRAAVTA